MPAARLTAHPIYLTLATTEPHGEGSLVRVAALREKDGAALERLVHGPRLTLAQSRLLGLTNSQLDRASEADEVLQELIDFAEGAGACIVPAGEAVRGALRQAGRQCGLARLPFPPVLGVDELAAIVLPSAGRRGLADLERHYAAAQPDDAALSDASEDEEPRSSGPGQVRELWAKLEAGLLKLPLPLLAEMNWLINKTELPLRKLLKAAEGEGVKEQFAGSFSAGKLSLDKLFKDFSPIIARLKPAEEGGDEAATDAPSEPVTAEQIDRIIGPGGPLAQGLPGYEERPEQVQMARRVAESLSSGKHLLVEAGTGVGKSLAYLIPAILFAHRAGRPVMLTTHTKNLQSQLFYKDVPFLKKHLGVPFEAALLKGRSNYLCLRKFMYTLQEAPHELDDEQRAQMLPIMTWAVQTESGDVSEMTAFSPEQNYELWDHLHTIGEDCLGRQCPFYQRCFVYKARGLARGADVVVLNHALVFAELSTEAGTLPPYSEIVFDEAHKLEDVATDHLACEVTPRRAFRILNRLFRLTPGSAAGKGLLPALLAHADQSRAEFPQPLHDGIRGHFLAAMQAVEPAQQGTELFFQTMRQWTESSERSGAAEPPVAPFVPRERGRNPAPESGPAPVENALAGRAKARAAFSGDDRKRFSAQTLRPDEADSFKQGKEAAIAALGRLRQALETLEDDFKEIRKRNVPRARELSREISAQNLFLSELIHDIEFVIKGEEANYVYWSEKLGRRAARVVAAPLDVAGLLHEQLYEKKRSVILTSATLSVRDADAGDASGLAPLGKKFGIAAAAGRTAKPASGEPHPKSFEFLKNRLGLSLCSPEQLSELLLGSPFDYAAQCKLFVPAFVPEPGSWREREFSDALTSLVGELAIASQGRALVLYTSYTALEAGARTLRKMLAPEGIEVLAQGTDGSRESLLARLKAGERTVLLGTSSFWEGVDVQGEALSLLVIAKLPFAVFTDPIVQGRCELLEANGKDAFLHFSVPNAILRLRQGFGRLIRSKTDKGIVVLADKRVVTKRYGAAFLRALPAQSVTMTSPDALVQAVREFLGAQ